MKMLRHPGYILFILLAILSITLTSCGKAEEPEPTGSGILAPRQRVVTSEPLSHSDFQSLLQ